MSEGKTKGGLGGKTVLNSHTPPHMPQWAIERLGHHMDRLYFNPPVPEKYRALFEEDEKD